MRENYDFAGMHLELIAPACLFERLPATYSPYRTSPGDPAIRLELVPDDTLPDERRLTSAHPAFVPTPEQGRVVFARADAYGYVTDARTAVFHVAANRHSMEAVIRLSLSQVAARENCLILHASAVEHEGQAHIFAGKSGAGKSTMARLLGEHTAASPLSDELLILRATGTQTLACVSPFLCSSGLPAGREVPVSATYFLAHGRAPKKRELPQERRLRELLQHVLVYAATPEIAGETLRVASHVAANVPGFLLEFAPRPDVAPVLGIT